MQRTICAMTTCMIGLIGLLGAVAVAPTARAAFHLYDVKDVFSNADGTVQFVELFTSANGQQFLNGHTIVASQAASTNTFNFGGTGPSLTASTHLLVATAGFQAACGIAPDFVMADGFLFDPDGSVNFAEGTDVVSYASLPLDGETSLDYPGEVAGTNSPTNHAGNTCTLAAALPVPSMTPWGLALVVVLLGLAGVALRGRARVTIGAS